MHDRWMLGINLALNDHKTIMSSLKKIAIQHSSITMYHTHTT